MWEGIQYVSGISTLLAFLAAIVATSFKWWLAHKEKLIYSAPENERAKLVIDLIKHHPLNIVTLTKEQRHKLAIEQIHARTAMFTKSTVTACFIATLAAIVLIVSLMNNSEGQSNLPKVRNCVTALEQNATLLEMESLSERIGLANEKLQSMSVEYSDNELKRPYLLNLNKQNRERINDIVESLKRQREALPKKRTERTKEETKQFKTISFQIFEYQKKIRSIDTNENAFISSLKTGKLEIEKISRHLANDNVRQTLLRTNFSIEVCKS